MTELEQIQQEITLQFSVTLSERVHMHFTFNKKGRFMKTYRMKVRTSMDEICIVQVVKDFKEEMTDAR